MTPASAKAKGRKLQQLIRDKIIQALDLKADDVRSTSMGAGGEDIQLSYAARMRFPFSIECKSHAKMAIYTLYQQAEENSGGHTPLLVVKSNGNKPLAVLDFDHFLSLVERATR
jgi:hypothetical protein